MNKKKRILIADDDAAILDAMQLMLEDAGYDVKTTVDGAGLSTMEKDFPDLLLLDIWMSGQDGREICEMLKSKQATRHIPIVMISANRDTEKISKEAGANDFLTKPFEMADLLSTVAKYIGK